MSLGLAVSLASMSGSVSYPSYLSPKFWLRSDYGLTTVGSTVTSWADKSGNGNTFSVGALVAPGYTSGQYNGHPGVNGVDGTRGLANAGVANPGTSSTFVFEMSRSTLANSYIACNSSAFTSVIQGFTASSIEWFNSGGTDRDTLASSLSAGLHQIIITQVDGVSLIGYVDGVQAFSVVPNVSANHAIQNLFGYGAGTNGTNGDIVEVVMLGSNVNVSQVSALHAYAQSFWGSP